MSCVELCGYRLNTSTQSCFSLIINFKLLRHFSFVSCNVVTQKEKIKKNEIKAPTNQFKILQAAEIASSV